MQKEKSQNEITRSKAANEWSFNFVASRMDNETITEPLVNKFWDAVCQAAEENGIMLGGGFEPTNES